MHHTRFNISDTKIGLILVRLVTECGMEILTVNNEFCVVPDTRQLYGFRGLGCTCLKVLKALVAVKYSFDPLQNTTWSIPG